MSPDSASISPPPVREGWSKPQAAPEQGWKETPGAAARQPWVSAKGSTGRLRPCCTARWSWGQTDYQESMVCSTPARPHCQTLDLGSPAPPAAEESETEGCLCPGPQQKPLGLPGAQPVPPSGCWWKQSCAPKGLRSPQSEGQLHFPDIQHVHLLHEPIPLTGRDRDGPLG